MGKKLGVSLKIDEDKVEQIDSLAAASSRDRTFIINEAITNYLEVHKWQIEQIKIGLAEADAEEFASDDEIAKVLNRWQS